MHINKIVDIASRMEGIVKDSSPYHLYRYIGLGIGDDGISALATDGEITVQAWSTTDIKHRVAVQARVFIEAMKTMKGDVRFDADQNQVIATSQDAEFRFATTDYDALPVPQEIEGGIEISGIATLMRMVGTSASKDNARDILNAIYFDGENAVAADGFRMAVMPYVFPGRAIVPLEPMRAVARLVGDDPVQVALSDNQCMFSTADMRIWSQQIHNASYVDYKAVLQSVDQCDKVMRANTGDMIRALRRAALFSEYARLEIQNNRVIVNASGDLGGVRDEASVEADFSISVRFNCEYLIRLLSAAGSSDVTIAIKDGRSPVGIADQYGWRAAIMPVVIGDDQENSA